MQTKFSSFSQGESNQDFFISISCPVSFPEALVLIGSFEKMAVFNALNSNNEVFCGYITWGGLLIIKMLLMAFLTAFQRARKGVSNISN